MEALKNRYRDQAHLKALLAMGGRGGEKPPSFPTGAFRPSDPGFFDPNKPIASYKDAPIKVPAGNESEIVWLKSLDEAKKIAREAGAPVLVEFYFDSCAFCAAMARGPLRDSQVANF